MYFNPRSHERSDHLNQYLPMAMLISIHAPTRGATPLPGIHILLLCISIHAPTRGATATWTSDIPEDKISIHAPTRGATQPCTVDVFSLRFQSTLPREERLKTDSRYTDMFDHFNPRSHERSDKCCTDD